jgi:hypothetical protein
MTEIVSLSDIKRHLRMEEDDTDQDEDLEAMIIAARRAAEIHLERPVVGDAVDLTADDLAVVGRAIRLTIGSWFRDREGSGALPPVAAGLLNLLKRWPSE